MSITPVKSSSGNTGIVPPWLRPDPDEPHTWAELEAMLNDHGFTEFRADEFPIPTHYEQETTL